jgi:hypothetical protein
LSAEVIRLLLVTAIGITLVIPLIIRAARRQFDPFDPMVVFAVAYGVMFVVRPLHIVLSHDYSYRAPLSVVNVEPRFTEMLVLALVGAASFVIGYHSRAAMSSPRNPRLPRALNSSNAIVAAGLFGVLGLCSFFLFISQAGGLETFSLLLQGRTPKLDEAIRSLSLYPWLATLMLLPASLVFFALGWRRRSPALLAASLFASSVLLLRAIPGGDRMVLLPFVGGIFVFSYLRRSTRPKILTLLLVALVALVMSTLLSDLRGRSTRNETAAQTVANLFSHPLRVVTRITRGPDTEMAAVFAAALRVIPDELPHTYGKTIFGDLVSRPIPRAAWPDKPEPPRDQVIAKLWPAEHSRGSINPAFSVLLFLYWDFGVIGVAIGLFVGGFISRWLYDFLCERPGDVFVQLLYSVTLWFLVIALRDGPVDTLIRAVFIIFPLYAVALAARRHRFTWLARPSTKQIRHEA